MTPRASVIATIEVHRNSALIVLLNLYEVFFQKEGCIHRFMLAECTTACARVVAEHCTVFLIEYNNCPSNTSLELNTNITIGMQDAEWPLELLCH